MTGADVGAYAIGGLVGMFLIAFGFAYGQSHAEAAEVGKTFQNSDWAVAALGWKTTVSGVEVDELRIALTEDMLQQHGGLPYTLYRNGQVQMHMQMFPQIKIEPKGGVQ